MSIESFLNCVEDVEKKGDLKALMIQHGVTVEQVTQHHNALEAKVDELRAKGNSFQRLASLKDKISNLKTLGFRQATDFIESNFPSIFSICYPRKFRMPNGYVSPKRLCLPFLHALWELSSLAERDFVAPRIETQTSIHIYKIMGTLAPLSVPTYFVGKDCIHALINTDLPKDFSLKEMPWPMDALVFVIPEGVLTSPEGSITTIVVGRLTAQDYSIPISWDNVFLDTALKTEGVKHFEESVAVLGLTDAGKVYTWQAPLNDQSIHDAAIVCATGAQIGMEEGLDSNEQIFVTSNLPRTTFQLILAMLAAPELIEKESCERPAKVKKGKTIDALWTPNFFGRAYRRHEGHGEGISPRMHWRRGHFRHQRYGPGFASIRVLWIRPVLVNKK